MTASRSDCRSSRRSVSLNEPARMTPMRRKPMRRRGAAPSRRRYRFRSARQALTEASQAPGPVVDHLTAPVERAIGPDPRVFWPIRAYSRTSGALACRRVTRARPPSFESRAPR